MTKDREIERLFREAEGEGFPDTLPEQDDVIWKLFFRGAPWDQKEYREFLEYMIAAMEKIFGRTFREEKIREAVCTGKLETRWGEEK